MSFLDRIRFRGQEGKKELQQGLDSVKEAYGEAKSSDEGREGAIRVAAEKAIEALIANPNMSAKELIAMINEEEGLPVDVVVKIAKQLPRKEEKTIVGITEEYDLPSKGLQEILNEADVSLNAARKIVAQIPDEEIQREEEKRIRKEQEINNFQRLKKIYKNCVNMNDLEVVKQIKAVKQSKRFEQSDRIQELISRIISKRIAIDCLEHGGPIINRMTSIVSASDMLKMDFSQKAEKEYEQLITQEEYANKKRYPYDKKLVKEKMLEVDAKEVANSAENNVTSISIPQFIQSPEEVAIFKKALKTFFKKGKISEEEVKYLEKLDNLKNSEEDELQMAITELIGMIQSLPSGTAIKAVGMIRDSLNGYMRHKAGKENLETTTPSFQTGTNVDERL